MKPMDLPLDEVLAAQAGAPTAGQPPARPPRVRLGARLWASLTPRRLLLLLVGLPMLLASVYFTVLAQKRYVSTSIVTVRRAGSDGFSAGGLAVLLAGTGVSSHEDARYLRDYLHSLALMRKLDERLQLRRHFEATRTDPFYRLWPQADQEWMLEYWRSRVTVHFDELSGLLTLHIEGFDADYAQQLNKALLQESERFVNDISQRIAREQMAFAQGELERAAQAVQVARTAVLGFQTQHRMLDPVAQAHANGALTAELRVQLAKVETELNARRAYLNEDAPDVVALKNQAAALRQQADVEAKGATGASSGALNRLAVDFHALKARAGFAEDAYKAALAALENTRLETARKVKSLVVIEPPTLPESAEYPRRIYNLITVLVACLLLYATVRLTVATVNEHRD